MTARRKAQPPPLPPVTAAFRAACHALVDRMLDAFPGTEVALFAVDFVRDVDAGSVPSGITVKRGMIDTLYTKINAEPSE